MRSAGAEAEAEEAGGGARGVAGLGCGGARGGVEGGAVKWNVMVRRGEGEEEHVASRRDSIIARN